MTRMYGKSFSVDYILIYLLFNKCKVPYDEWTIFIIIWLVFTINIYIYEKSLNNDEFTIANNLIKFHPIDEE